MNGYSIAALLAVGTFYISYFAKALNLKSKGIKANRLGAGEKPQAVKHFEIIALIFTYSMAVVQVGSILWAKMPLLFHASLIRIAGLLVAFIGVAFFISAIITMRISWRAGIDKSQKTELVTSGVYQWSRNPAFVGFDLLYIGIALCFPNVVNTVLALCGVLIFHKQILNEEEYLKVSFGKSYLDYTLKTNRYLGKN